MKRYWIVSWNLISSTQKGGSPPGVTTENNKYLNAKETREKNSEKYWI